MCDASKYRFDPESHYLRIRGVSGLSPQGLAILRQLTIWRDEAAREEDLPPRSLLKDEVLMEMSRHPVKTIERLGRVRGLPRPIESRYGERIVESTHRALSL